MADKVTIDGLEFYVHPIGTNYKDVAGVYVFLASSENKWRIRYIGETESLKSRLTDKLLQHHRYECAVTRGKATHIATRAVAGGKTARLDLETRLRGLFDPPCNRQWPLIAPIWPLALLIRRWGLVRLG